MHSPGIHYLLLTQTGDIPMKPLLLVRKWISELLLLQCLGISALASKQSGMDRQCLTFSALVTCPQVPCPQRCINGVLLPWPPQPRKTFYREGARRTPLSSVRCLPTPLYRKSWAALPHGHALLRAHPLQSKLPPTLTRLVETVPGPLLGGIALSELVIFAIRGRGKPASPLSPYV